MEKCEINVHKALRIISGSFSTRKNDEKSVFKLFFSFSSSSGESAVAFVNNVVLFNQFKTFVGSCTLSKALKVLKVHEETINDRPNVHLNGKPNGCGPAQSSKSFVCFVLGSRQPSKHCLIFPIFKILSKDLKLTKEYPNGQPNEQPNGHVFTISFKTLVGFAPGRCCNLDLCAESQNGFCSSCARSTSPNCLIIVSTYRMSMMNVTKVLTFLNRSLLAQCGDIESNPGPGPEDQDLEGAGIGGRDRLTSRPGKSDLNVQTFNVRGLSDRKKVRHIVNNCYKLSKDSVNSFFMFQEIFVTRLDILNYLWRGDFHLTAGTGNARGCLTLITPPYKIINARDLEDRAHVLVLTKNNLDKAEIILVNVYAPNGFDDAKIRFFEELVERVTDTMATYNCNNVILAGDFNVVLCQEELKNRVYSNAEARVAGRLKDMFQQLNLDDGWEKAPRKQFTWNSNRSGQLTCSTLDRVLFTKDQFNLMNMTTDWALSLSDHAAVSAKLKCSENKKVKHSQISRLDPRLLLDAEGRLHLDTRFRELADQAMADWTPHVRLEYYKMCIRSAANDANGKIKAKIRDAEATLNADINSIVEELSASGLMLERKELLMNKLDDLRQLKRSLVEKVGTRLEQRAARKWYNEGELSNKYFFNLLNRKNNDEVTSVFDEHGTEINEPTVIDEKITDFYKKLYESVDANIVDNDLIFRNVPQVTQLEANRMTEELTLEELSATLKTCADSAPGPDGIPYSFLKHFWQDFGPVLLESWKYSLRTKELPMSHRVSYLRLIPKAGKDTRVIANLRPITLSNTDHKLITKTYARKLTDVVADCIGEEQTAYIPGRLINDNVRSLLMSIDQANSDRNVDGLVVSLDAKKAFDSVDHRYIKNCLKAFGLENFVGIFEVLYKGLRSNIILNGRVLDGYSILKGVKQGDALSCIIFIMCMEPLIRNIKANPSVMPVTSNVLNFELPKVYSFADDVTVVTKNNQRGLQTIFNEYEDFTKTSGLELNAGKTEVLPFNEHPQAGLVLNVRYNGATHQLKTMNEIKVNGVLLLQDVERREEINVAKAIEAMERLLMAWSTRRLTLIGRILIIKTFAISKLIYLMQTLTLSEKSYKAFIKPVFKFLWNRNYNAARAPERLKRSIMYTPLHLGGFGMVDIAALGDSLDLRSYGRLQVSKHPFMAKVRESIITNNFFNLRFEANVDKKAKRGLILVNEARQKMLNWDCETLIKDVNLRQAIMNHGLKDLMSAQGLRSLTYFAIHTRLPRIRLAQLTLREFQSIERFVIYPELRRVITRLLSMPLNLINVQGSVNSNEIFPIKEGSLGRISAMSSKQLRLSRVNEAENLICIFKLGPILTPGEVLSWTKRVRRLTSTRHKNIILRTVHGDIFSNGRLARFGLRTDSHCPNCQEQNESIMHKIRECPHALEAWEELERVKGRLNLNILSDLSIENLIGAKDNVTKLELALQAELIHRLTSRNVTYQPKELVKIVIRYIGYSERLDEALKERFNEVLRSWNG